MKPENTVSNVNQFKFIRYQLTSFLMRYNFALNEMETRITNLQEEFQMLHDYNPIEHIKSRLKSPESIMKKIHRKGGAQSLDEVSELIKDIAGIRITCSFINDIYTIRDMLQNQHDLKIVQIKDYIQSPKPNGYRSLHILAQVPVFLSDRQERVYVEIQVRTIAMDFWASLEHKIFYKYNQSIPQTLLQELSDAAEAAYALDHKMEKLHRQVEEIKLTREAENNRDAELLLGEKSLPIPDALLKLVQPSQSQ